MKTIGIDPGYDRLGIAVISKEEGSSKETLIFSTCVTTTKNLEQHERLYEIGEALRTIIKEHKPDSLALESLFFSINKKTAIKVAEARGVILYEAARAHIPVFEYAPSQIKIAVTGHGATDKKQVTMMVRKIIKIDREIQYDDEYDAIAVALTHLASEKIKKIRAH
jgi:crossover junction endodeoxyribonuclease RuvC